MMKRIYAIMMCVCGLTGEAMASESEDETLAVVQPRMAVAQDEPRDGFVGDRRNVFYIQEEDDGFLVGINFKYKITSQQIKDAWERNRHYVYVALAAASVTLLCNGRPIKDINLTKIN